MDHKLIGKKVTGFLGKYRYVLLILCIGVLLMCLPSFSSEEGKEKTQETEQFQKADLTKELEEILSMVDGAGDVKVILTVAEEERVEYQYDESITQGENGSIDRQTVIVTGSDRGQSGLVTHKLAPKYQGAVIVCEGADRASVRLNIMEAVAAATGLGMDRISVLKMK